MPYLISVPGSEHLADNRQLPPQIRTLPCHYFPNPNCKFPSHPVDFRQIICPVNHLGHVIYDKRPDLDHRAALTALSPSLSLARDHGLDFDFDSEFWNVCCARRNPTYLYLYSRDAAHLDHHVFEDGHPFLLKVDRLLEAGHLSEDGHPLEADHLVFLRRAHS